MVMGVPINEAIRFISAISAGSTQPGRIFTLPLRRCDRFASAAMALTILAKPVT
jgi:hypothetical protein